MEPFGVLAFVGVPGLTVPGLTGVSELLFGFSGVTGVFGFSGLVGVSGFVGFVGVVG